MKSDHDRDPQQSRLYTFFYFLGGVINLRSRWVIAWVLGQRLVAVGDPVQMEVDIRAISNKNKKESPVSPKNDFDQVEPIFGVISKGQLLTLPSRST